MSFLHKVEATLLGDSPYFGTVDNAHWAVCIEGVANRFPEQPFDLRLADLRKAQEFMKSAQTHRVGTRGRPTLAAVEQEVKRLGLSQYYARWTKDAAGKDDSVLVYYKD